MPAPRQSPNGPFAVGAWILYDLANTLFSMNIVSLYFPLWVVAVSGGTDATFGVANGLSMAAIFVLSPFLGALTDHAGRRMPFLTAATLACVGLTWFLGRGGPAISLWLFAAANVAYQAGLQFYDALLPEVSTPRTRGRIGGIGVGVGYLGSVLGVLAAMVILGDHPDAKQYDRLFRWTAALFLAFALPCLLLVSERRRPGGRLTAAALGASVRRVAETFRRARRRPMLFRFLAARACYTDAINTVTIFMGIYVVKEAGFDQRQVSVLMLTAIACAAAGAPLWGRVVDAIGAKRTLDLVLVLWTADLAWCAACGFFRLPPAAFWPVAILAGVAMGGTWAADRPLMLQMTPPARIGEFYGLYGMVGRFSAVVGPLLWALVVDGLGWGRPAAVLTLLAAVIAALALLRPVPNGSETARRRPSSDSVHP